MHHADESIRLMPASSWSGLGEGAKTLVHAVSGQREECLALLDDPTFVAPAEGAPSPAGQHFRFHSALVAACIIGSKEHAERWYPGAAARWTNSVIWVST